MTPSRVGLIAAESALERDQALGPLLEGLNARLHAPPLYSAARFAERGYLAEALITLGFPRPLTDVAMQWPKATRRARHAVEGVVTGSALARVRLTSIGSFFAAIWLVQLVVQTVLKLKILPVLVKESGDLHVAFPAPAQLGLDLLGWSPMVLVPVGFWFVVGLVTIRFAPWRSSDHQARSIAIAAALVETSAPADVVARWLRTAGLPLGEGRASDLAALAQRLAHRSRRRAERFAASVAFLAWSWLAAQAMVILFAVYSAISVLPLGV